MNIVFLFSCFLSKALSLDLVALTTSDVNILFKLRKAVVFHYQKGISTITMNILDAKERLSTQIERKDSQAVQVNTPYNIVQKMEDRDVMMISVAMMHMLNIIKGNSQNDYLKKLHLSYLLNCFKVTVLKNLKYIKYCDRRSRMKFQSYLVRKARSNFKHSNPKLKYYFPNLNSRRKRSASNSFTFNDSSRLSHSSKEGRGSASSRKPRGRLVTKILAVDPDAMENKVTTEVTNNSRQIQTKTDPAHNHTSSKFDISKYRQLGHQLELERSKDPLWAFICMVGLLVLLAFCSYCCRLSRINREHDIHVDIDESFHYASLKDILMGKKRFLPMFRKKMYRRKYRQLKEVELANPDSETSEEELMLFDMSHQTRTGLEWKPRS